MISRSQQAVADLEARPPFKACLADREVALHISISFFIIDFQASTGITLFFGKLTPKLVLSVGSGFWVAA